MLLNVRNKQFHERGGVCDEVNNQVSGSHSCPPIVAPCLSEIAYFIFTTVDVSASTQAPTAASPNLAAHLVSSRLTLYPAKGRDDPT